VTTRPPHTSLWSDQLAGLANVDEVLHSLARLLRTTVRSRWMVVYLLDRERRDFTPAHSSGLPARYRSMFRDMPLVPDKIPLLKAMLRKRQHMLIADAGTSRLLNPNLRKLMAKISLVAVPMVVHNQLLGAVFVARTAEFPPFAPEEITAIRAMVSHAALVVSHIRLFDESLEMAVEMAKRIDVILTLDEINKAISSSLSHAKIIETAMENIERIIRCEIVAVLEKRKDTLEVVASRASGVTIPPILEPGSQIRSESLRGTVLARAEGRYMASLSSAPRLPALERSLLKAGIESLLTVPLASKETVKGYLLLGDTTPGQFVREDAFTIEKVAAQMAVALENARLYEEMQTLFISTVSSLANAIDAKSPWTKGHSERVMRVSTNIAKEMELPEPVVERVRLAGLLHDIGKIGIIEALLEKPESLSEDEFPPMRLHPEKGVAILSPIEQLQDTIPGVLYHHERFDGTGYPKGLRGEEIPLEARIIAVADSFDAMISERPYKKGLSVAEALVELRECSGTQFDAIVVEALCRYLGKKRLRMPEEI